MNMLWESIRSALESVRAHGFRSLLTSLGIIIGVTSVIAVVSIVQGLSYTVNAQFAGLGGNSLTVRSYTPFKQQLQGNLAKLSDSDMEAIASRIDGISHITPILYTQSGTQGVISYRSQSSFTRVVGIGSSYLEVNSVYPERGRFFSRDDDVRRRLVCAVGVDVIENLKMPIQAVGEFFRVGNEWCKIVGIMEKRGELLGFSQDDYVLLPYGTAKRIMGSQRDLDIQIQLLVDDMNRQDEVKERIRRVLRQEHALKSGQPDDFKVQTAEQLTESFNAVINTITAVSAGIVGISLLVGGIGIMNIMLVSVTERTREIGILKALGATRQDILLQFLIEALVLCMIGGLAGVAIGYGLGALVSNLLPGFPEAHVPLWAVMLSFGFCAAVGVIFGIVPAAKAAQLDPIDALRYE
ncbi:MAG: FtsX-like permease family protein [Xanthomonadales bacterium]|nr:ABC transporter permease [Gammaproteobacteria bacterium]MBT8054897.1 ABC transporter permease [Gammaproteobacteria bacterium]NND58172.1 FtsX-like permease family protein [Xanthomonadales bacterium]NNK50029.1 FtsX-like permease family protein [Xanthomonadales bacterium]